MSEPTWTPRNGRKILVKDMELTHLWNTMKLLERAFENRKFVVDELRRATRAEQMILLEVDDAPLSSLLEGQMREVCDRITNATHPRDIWPIYDAIKAEYDKRVAPYTPRD